MLKTVDLRACADLPAVHQVLAEQLEFPAWYGHNLDALYDMLCGEPELELQLLCPAAGPLVESGELTTLLLVMADALGERAVVMENEAAAVAEEPAEEQPLCEDVLK